MTVRLSPRAIRAALARAMLAIAILGGIGPVHARTLDARVIHVVDGDTLVVQSGREALTIRMLYIDAPEHDQPYGREARRSLEQLVRLDRVRVDTKGRDKYGRTLARVIRAADGLDVNLAQVERGLAWCYSRSDARADIEAAEGGARRARRGLWADARPISPRTWRRTHGPSRP